MVYGSNNGGHTVQTSNSEVNKLMEDAGKVMNLSGHVVSGKIIYGPGDIEVHVGKVFFFFFLPGEKFLRGGWVVFFFPSGLT